MVYTLCKAALQSILLGQLFELAAKLVKCLDFLIIFKGYKELNGIMSRSSVKLDGEEIGPIYRLILLVLDIYNQWKTIRCNPFSLLVFTEK